MKKRCIIKALQQYMPTDELLEEQEMIVWLGKQLEQKPIDKVNLKFNIGDTIVKKHNSDINKFGQFTITDINGNKYWYNNSIICDIAEQDDWELAEQKSAEWSEEDENVLRDIKTAVASYWYEDIENIILDWLESLRPQKRWKPTGEQMQALKKVCDRLYPLYSLYEQLKKLNGYE